MNTSVLPYFPRKTLLNKVVKAYELTNAVTLFAPRRCGKTWFAKYDLIPYARNTLHWQVVYADLWERQDNPGRALVEAIEGTRRDGSRHTRAFRLDELSAKAGSSWAGAGAVFRATEHSDDLKGRLREGLDKATRKHKLLLVIDEVQALAGVRDKALVAALRTAVQAHEDRLRVFFTGSSRDGLNHLFRERRAALFASAYTLVLPDLGEGFVRDRLRILHERNVRGVSFDELMQAFADLAFTPEYLNDIVISMILSANADVGAAFESWYRDHIREMRDENRTLKPLDRALLAFLATHGDDGAGVYAESSLRWLRRHVRDVPVTTSSVQGAMRKLRRRGLVSPTGEPGAYEVEDRTMLIQLRREGVAP